MLSKKLHNSGLHQSWMHQIQAMIPKDEIRLLDQILKAHKSTQNTKNPKKKYSVECACALLYFSCVLLSVSVLFCTFFLFCRVFLFFCTFLLFCRVFLFFCTFFLFCRVFLFFCTFLLFCQVFLFFCTFFLFCRVFLFFCTFLLFCRVFLCSSVPIPLQNIVRNRRFYLFLLLKSPMAIGCCLRPRSAGRTNYLSRRPYFPSKRARQHFLAFRSLDSLFGRRAQTQRCMCGGAMS